MESSSPASLNNQLTSVVMFTWTFRHRRSSTAVENMEEPNPIVAFFTNLFASIKLPFPPKKELPPASSSSPPKSEDVQRFKPVVEDVSDKPGVVAFPRQSFAPLKLEAEAEDAERNTNPVLLWQVYAIGGFFILRWAWTRWNERKGQKKPDDGPSPPRD